MMFRRIAPLVVATGIALTLVGCSDDNGSSESSQPSTTEVSPPPEVMKATLTETKSGASGGTATYAATWWRDGSYRFIAQDGTRASSFNARTSTLRNLDAFDGKVVGTEQVNSPTNAGLVADRITEPDLANWVTAAGARKASSEQVAGREVWRVDADVPQDQLAVESPDRVELAVDKVTGTTLSLREYMDDKLLRETVATDVSVLPSSNDTVDLDFPAGTEVQTFDAKCSLVPINEVPENTPFLGDPTNDFELMGVRECAEPQPSGAEGLNPSGTSQVSAVLARDWSRVHVNVRGYEGSPSEWSDPYGSEGRTFEGDERLVKDGAFMGRNANVVSQVGVVPHAWVVGDSYEADVSGSIDSERLVGFLEALD